MSAIPESIADEARAKIIWGESVEKVRVFLAAKQVPPAEAELFIESVVVERAESFRSEGKKKIGLGAVLLLIPIIYYFVAAALGFLLLKLFAALLVLAAVGLAKISKGIAMVLRPRAVTETLADRF